MTFNPAPPEKPELAEHEVSAKRRRIMEGARAVFLAQGFDAASMGGIARKARVSKGTLYVYFDSKEKLFEAIVHEECAAQAEMVFSLDPADHDVEAVLTRLGRGFVRFLCRPGAMSPLRTVISISERMPEIGKEFYETGQAEEVAKLRQYLENQAAAGILRIEDCEIAAAQFLDSCVATILKPLLFNAGDAPTDQRINHVVGIARFSPPTSVSPNFKAALSDVVDARLRVRAAAGADGVACDARFPLLIALWGSARSRQSSKNDALQLGETGNRHKLEADFESIRGPCRSRRSLEGKP